jgi:predicted nuclease of predicted toxin-antitoxin system
MKIVIDMNLSTAWVDVLEDAGIEARHWVHVGQRDALDEEIFDWALHNQHVIMTRDLGFAAILGRSGKARPSLIQIRSDKVNAQIAGSFVVESIKSASDALNAGCLLTIEPDRSRTKSLPLRAAPFHEAED